MKADGGGLDNKMQTTQNNSCIAYSLLDGRYDRESLIIRKHCGLYTLCLKSVVIGLPLITTLIGIRSSGPANCAHYS